jgi:hypothetical protein
MGEHEARMAGVSLDQYAGVTAGVAEAFPLDAVLANEGIDPRVWPRAEEAWADRLASEGETDRALQEVFDERLREARARYGVRVQPLDDDLRAWLDFFRRWSESPDPLALLGGFGLRATDVMQLHQTWSQRLGADPALQKQAQEILAEEPGDPVAITTSARVMIPNAGSFAAPAPRAALPWPRPDDAALGAAGPAGPGRGKGADDEDPEDTQLDAAGAPPPLFVAFPGWPVAIGAAPAPVPVTRSPDEDAAAMPAVLPFQAPAPAPLTPPPPRPAGASKTVEITANELSPFAMAPALPFQAAELEEPSTVPIQVPSPLHAVYPEGPPPEPVSPPRKKVAQTMEWVLTPPSAALPFSAGPAAQSPPPAGGAAPLLTLDQHAALHAELAVAPHDAASVLARYRLTPQAQALVDEHWRNQLAAAPAMRTVWGEAYQAYCIAFAKRNQGNP